MRLDIFIHKIDRYGFLLCIPPLEFPSAMAIVILSTDLWRIQEELPKSCIKYMINIYYFYVRVK